MYRSSKKRPCIYMESYVDEGGNTSYAITCDRKNCEGCGWYPKEQQRRLEQGEFRPSKVRIILYSSEKDKRGHMVEYTVEKTLHFPPRYHKGKGDIA